MSLTQQITYWKGHFSKMTMYIKNCSQEKFPQPNMFLFEEKKKFVIAGQNWLDRSSRKSSSLFHRHPLCFVLRLWTQQHFPNWFSENKTRMKDLNVKYSRCWLPHTLFSLLTGMWIAGVQPRLIQGIRSGDGVSDLFNYLFIKDIKSNRMRIAL